jgi:hypothetical protein
MTLSSPRRWPGLEGFSRTRENDLALRDSSVPNRGDSESSGESVAIGLEIQGIDGRERTERAQG